MKHKIKNINNGWRGFTLLLSLIVVSILTSVGLGVFDIVLREIVLSSFGRESQKAFYAADTGVECVLYHDLRLGKFDSPTYNISCAEQTVNGIMVSSTTSFTLDFADGSCADIVSLDKSGAFTSLEVRGYNVGCSADHPRKVERGLRVVY
jgi:hypothetical protein